MLILVLCYFALCQAYRGCFEVPSTGFYEIEYSNQFGLKFNATNFCFVDGTGGWTLIAKSVNGAPTRYDNFESIPFGWKFNSNTNLQCGANWFVYCIIVIHQCGKWTTVQLWNSSVFKRKWFGNRRSSCWQLFKSIFSGF